MNPEHQGPEEVESRITALLLGELETAEAMELEAAIEKDPELARLRDRLRQTIDLVREATTPQPETASALPFAGQLSEPRRTELLKRFKVVPLVEGASRKQTRSWIIPIATAAGLTVALSLLSFSLGSWRLWDLAQGAMVFKMASQIPATLPIDSEVALPTRLYRSTEARRLAEDAMAIAELQRKSSSAASYGAMQVRSHGIELPPVPPVTAEAYARSAGQAGQREGFVLRGGDAASMAWRDYDNDGNVDYLIRNGGIGGGGGGGDRLAFSVPGNESLFARNDDQPAMAGADRNWAFARNGRGDQERFFDAVGNLEEGQQLYRNLGAGQFTARGRSRGAETIDLGVTALGDKPSLGRLLTRRAAPTPSTADAKEIGVGLAGKPVLESAPTDGERLERLEEAEKLEERIGIDIAAVTESESRSYFTAGAEVTLGYGVTNQVEAEIRQRVLAVPEPQPEVLVVEQPFSTFSLNVSDVSFKLAAASLDNGVMPEPSTVRTEEFINAFDYRDPEPLGGAALSLNWERARYPFAHNRELIRFSVRTWARGRALDRPLNLVLLLDSSGSMERADRVGIIREAMRVLAAQIQPQDRVSVVSFARTPRLWVDGLEGRDATQLPGLVGELTPEGGTNLEEALALAYETASRHFVVGGVNRVVLLTDGAANLGVVEPQVLQGQVEANRLKGIALDCFGIGWEGYNDDLLETLSRHGDGRYGFVNTPEEAASGFADQLAGALEIAAANVKVQVEFNPARVTAYRQVGYAKHQLTEEQFRDNTVDAAEIGAAESGNALYVAQVEPQGQGPIGLVRARYQEPATGEYHEVEWVLPYMGPAPGLEASSATLRLAGVAAAFAEWLARSPFAGEVTPDRLLPLLEGVPETFQSDPRPRQLGQMIRQGTALAGGSPN
jgi:Mg-chelatase subunit ChlD